MIFFYTILFFKENDEIFHEYKVLARPSLDVPDTRQENTACLDYSDESSPEPSDDDSEDSDVDGAGTNGVCRKKVRMSTGKIRKRYNKTRTEAEDERQRSKYKVWCKQVQEESLTSNLGSCEITKKNSAFQVNIKTNKFF